MIFDQESERVQVANVDRGLEAALRTKRKSDFWRRARIDCNLAERIARRATAQRTRRAHTEQARDCDQQTIQTCSLSDQGRQN